MKGGATAIGERYGESRPERRWGDGVPGATDAAECSRPHTHRIRQRRSRSEERWPGAPPAWCPKCGGNVTEVQWCDLEGHIWGFHLAPMHQAATCDDCGAAMPYPTDADAARWQREADEARWWKQQVKRGGTLVAPGGEG